MEAHQKHMDQRIQRKRTKPIMKDYSLIVSTESARINPTKFILSNGKELLIPRGHVAIWSSEYLHADASYQVRNRRLFIAITSKKTVQELKSDEEVSH